MRLISLSTKGLPSLEEPNPEQENVVEMLEELTKKTQVHNKNYRESK